MRLAPKRPPAVLQIAAGRGWMWWTGRLGPGWPRLHLQKLCSSRWRRAPHRAQRSGAPHSLKDAWTHSSASTSANTGTKLLSTFAPLPAADQTVLALARHHWTLHLPLSTLITIKTPTGGHKRPLELIWNSDNVEKSSDSFPLRPHFWGLRLINYKQHVFKEKNSSRHGEIKKKKHTSCYSVNSSCMSNICQFNSLATNLVDYYKTVNTFNWMLVGG